MEALLSIAVGLGLSAACGFRIFVPLLVVGAAERTGHLDLASGFEWMSSTPAMVAFGTATLLEIGAYYVPFIDNLLDTVAAPTAVAAGVITTASQVADMDPWMTWSIAIIGGGGVAGTVQGLTTITRQVSSLATAGFGNPLVSTFEAGASLVMALMAIVVPLLAVATLVVLMFFGAKKLFFRNAPNESTEPALENAVEP